MSRRSVAYIVGARPNFVKMAPVVQAMRAQAPSVRHIVVHTGQHYDREMSAIFLDELELPAPEHHLNVGSGSHGAQTARVLERIEHVFVNDRPDLVVVPGDVNSTLAAALAASKLQIPIAHIEAGLRSFDRTMPEEINRVLVDQISRWCFIHSPEARENLLREGVAEERIVFAGNTMIDTLVRLRPVIERSRALMRLGLEPNRYLLVTLHRPRLVDGPLFLEVLQRLAALSRELPVVLPLHPRAASRIPVNFAGPQGFHLTEPVGYVDFLSLQTHAAGVLTDSGGVQEESTYLRVPCFTLRDNTERPITIRQGTNRLLGLRPEALASIPALLEQAVLPLGSPEGWDGRAGERVAETLVADLNRLEEGELTGARADSASSALVS